jgi:hypothetical protein
MRNRLKLGKFQSSPLPDFEVGSINSLPAIPALGGDVTPVITAAPQRMAYMNSLLTRAAQQGPPSYDRYANFCN